MDEGLWSSCHRQIANAVPRSYQLDARAAAVSAATGRPSCVFVGKERPEREAAEVAPLPWSVPLPLLLVGAAVEVPLVLVGAAEVVGVEVVLPPVSE